MKEKIEYDTKHIKVLDGIRTLSILIIVWYHFWQQTWIYHKIGPVSLDFIPRYGYLLVDMMILLSSFCLFLPYARSMVYKEELPSTKKFYIHRIARIVPSYYVSLIILFLILILSGKFVFNSFFIKDALMHMFFIQNWSFDTLISGTFNVVLWTVAIEVQYYLFFPFLAKRFTKKPGLTYFILTVIGLICIFIIKKNINDYNIGYYVNHFLTFIPVYANGMLACWFYVSYTKKNQRDNSNDLFFTIISILTILVYAYFCKSIQGNNNNIQLWQLDNRFILSLLFSLFIISTCLASKIYQKIFTNKVMIFICQISFNLYIYHQFIAVKLKEWRIPYWSGDTPPNMTSDAKWQWSYFLLCILVSLIVATIMTFGVERPLAKFIKEKYEKRKNKKSKD